MENAIEEITMIRMIRQVLLICYFNPNQVVGIAVADFGLSKSITYRIIEEHNSVPNWIRSEFTHKTMSDLRFENGSRIKVMYNLNSPRGVSLNVLYASTSINFTDDWHGAYLPCISHSTSNKVIYFK